MCTLAELSTIFHTHQPRLWHWLQGVELAKRIDDRVKEATLLLEATMGSWGEYGDVLEDSMGYFWKVIEDRM